MGILSSIIYQEIMKVSIITVLILMLEVCHGQGSLVTSKQDDLLCNICVDIVEDIDSWLTSDTTEQQIVDWLYAFCERLGDLLSPDLVQVCEVVLGSQLPNIIDNLVNNNLNPQEVCQQIGACSAF